MTIRHTLVLHGGPDNLDAYGMPNPYHRYDFYAGPLPKARLAAVGSVISVTSGTWLPNPPHVALKSGTPLDAIRNLRDQILKHYEREALQVETDIP